MAESSTQVGVDEWIEFKGKCLKHGGNEETPMSNLWPGNFPIKFTLGLDDGPRFPFLPTRLLIPDDAPPDKQPMFVVVRTEDVMVIEETPHHRLGATAIGLFRPFGPRRTTALLNDPLVITSPIPGVMDAPEGGKTACIGGIKFCCTTGRNLGVCHGRWDCRT